MLCTHEAHVWAWNSSQTNQPPPPGMVCNCGTFVVNEQGYVQPTFVGYTTDGRCPKCGKPLDDHKGAEACS